METLAYVLTDGDYSDYHIIAVYSTEDNAKKAQKEFGGEIEEWILDQYIKDNRYPYTVQMYSDGSTRAYIIANSDDVGYINHWSNQGILCISCKILAENKEAAIKIASEKAIQYKVAKNL